MIMYAIRHQPTGLYLPRTTGRGSTHHEPTAKLKTARLFHRSRDARGYLTVWLQGKQRQEAYCSSYESFYEDDVRLVTDKVPSRKREEMEVVPFELRELAQ